MYEWLLWLKILELYKSILNVRVLFLFLKTIRIKVIILCLHDALHIVAFLYPAKLQEYVLSKSLGLC